MKILITGSAGFIGFSLSHFLCLKNKNYKVIGIDNINNYYSKKLKKKRISNLKSLKNFNFINVDITNYKLLNKIFKKNKFDYVFNFAAQAGVRYSLHNPKSYLKSNINGFFNILQLVKKYKIKRLFYASSSSVYGDKKKYPTEETNESNPENMYSLSKRFNESITEIYSNHHGVNATGLRLFSVYGKWGRPDMFIFKVFKALLCKKYIELNNKGKHERDFTSIDDVKEILFRLLKNKKNKKHEIYNICSGKTVNIKKILNLLKKKYKLKYKNISRNSADLLKTHGSNKKLLKKIGRINFKRIEENIFDLLTWYEKNKIHRIS